MRLCHFPFLFLAPSSFSALILPFFSLRLFLSHAYNCAGSSAAFSSAGTSKKKDPEALKKKRERGGGIQAMPLAYTFHFIIYMYSHPLGYF